MGKIKIQWTATDGQVFDTETEAAAHQIKLNDKLVKGQDMIIINFKGLSKKIERGELENPSFIVAFNKSMRVQFGKNDKGHFEAVNAINGWGNNINHIVKGLNPTFTEIMKTSDLYKNEEEVLIARLTLLATKTIALIDKIESENILSSDVCDQIDRVRKFIKDNKIKSF